MLTISCTAGGFACGPHSTSAAGALGWRRWASWEDPLERLLEDRAIALILHQRCGERIPQHSAIDPRNGSGGGRVDRFGDAHRNPALPERGNEIEEPAFHFVRGRNRSGVIVQHCDTSPRPSTRFFTVSNGTAVAAEPARVQNPATITYLVVLNLALQLFDGVATYIGWEKFGEINPLLRAGFATWGAGPTLLVAKLFAAALLLWLARVARPALAGLGLTFTLGLYTALSFIPWSLCLFIGVI